MLIKVSKGQTLSISTTNNYSNYIDMISTYVKAASSIDPHLFFSRTCRLARILLRGSRQHRTKQQRLAGNPKITSTIPQTQTIQQESTGGRASITKPLQTEPITGRQKNIGSLRCSVAALASIHQGSQGSRHDNRGKASAQETTTAAKHPPEKDHYGKASVTRAITRSVAE